MAKKRGNNEGSITRRKDGLWQAALTIGRDPATGKLQRATFYAHTRKEAAEKLAKALQGKAQGTFVAPHKLALGAWLDTWLWEYKKPRVRALTFDSYEMLVRRHLKPALGHIALRSLRPEHLQHFYNEQAKAGFSARTIGYCHTLLGNALTQAEKNQLVARNVSRLVEAPREARKEMQTLSLAHVQTLLHALAADRLYAAFVMAVMTGLRRGELLGLRWQDVDLARGVLHVRQTLGRIRDHRAVGKTRLVFSEPKTAASRRTVPLPDECLTALKQHKARQAEEKLMLGQAYEDVGLVFCQPDGQPLDTKTLSRRLTQVLRQGGLPHIRLHDTRHTFATLMLEQGVSPKTVQTMLGHSSVAMTLDIYSHVSLELEKQAAATLNTALTGKRN